MSVRRPPPPRVTGGDIDDLWRANTKRRMEIVGLSRNAMRKLVDCSLSHMSEILDPAKNKTSTEYYSRIETVLAEAERKLGLRPTKGPDGAIEPFAVVERAPSPRRALPAPVEVRVPLVSPVGTPRAPAPATATPAAPSASQNAGSRNLPRDRDMRELVRAMAPSLSDDVLAAAFGAVLDMLTDEAAGVAFDTITASVRRR